MTDIAAYIDHTLLKTDATKSDICRLCSQADEYGFASVCVTPRFVETAAEALSESGVNVCSVVGFPLGSTLPEIKAAETREVVGRGASEVDMVLAVGALKEGDLDYALSDIAAVVRAAGGAIVKVIVETSLLSKEEKVEACKLAVKAGAHYVKTCSGFAGGGATVDDIELMRKAVGESFGVKASGGIKTRAAAQAMINAGATRIGTSSGVAIMSG